MRYCNDPLPSYAYVPGKNQRHQHLRLPPVPERYVGAQDQEFLNRFHFGIDCFNHAFYWETHEALEGLWHLVGRQTSDVGKGLQSIILLSSAHLKTFCQKHDSVRAWKSARRLLNDIDVSELKALGLDMEGYLRDLNSLLNSSENSRVPYQIVLQQPERPSNI